MNAKEQLENDILCQMELEDSQIRNRLRMVLWQALNAYEIKKRENTDIVQYDGRQNEKILRQYLISKSVQGLTDKSLKVYAVTIKEFMGEINGKSLLEVQPNDIRYYISVKKMRDKISDVSLDNIRRNLNAFYGWLIKEEYIKKNPMLKIERIRQEKIVKKAFNETEIERLRFTAKEDIRVTAILEVLLSTGCRVGELRNMNRSDLKGDEVIVKGKGKKQRVVYLNARSRFALTKYLASRDDENEALFVSSRKPHNRIETGGLEIIIRDLGKKAGVECVHPHRFRRTAATLALNRGMPIEEVRQMLGHESMNTTLIYAQSAQENVKRSHKKYLY